MNYGDVKVSFCSRFGWIGRKIGMTNILFNGKVSAVTLIEVLPQNILSNIEKEDSSVLRIGVEMGKLRKNPQRVELQKLNQPLCKVVKEFKVTKEEASSVVNSYGVDLLESEKFLDVTSNGVGKGFAGGMKRWNFCGASASHGTSLTHRAIGSTGTREKSWPGKKMPGRLGGKKITIQSLPIVEIDKDLRLVALHGSVPGKPGNIVILRKAIKKQGVKHANKR